MYLPETNSSLRPIGDSLHQGALGRAEPWEWRGSGGHGRDDEVLLKMRLSYSTAWMTTRPPSLTSTYRPWPASSRIPMSGVVSATLTLVRLG